MKQFLAISAAAIACAVQLFFNPANAQTAIPPSISTPDKVESRIGTLEFKDGVPSKATADKVYDNLDFTYAYRAFMDNLRGVSIHALRKGMLSIGVKDNEVLVFSELMDAKSLFLTANADTIYVMGSLDLTKGPVVLETPPKFLGAVQDAWFRWVIDLGVPGSRPRRGRQVSDRAAGLQRPAAGGRVLRRARRAPTPSCGSADRSWRITAIPSRWWRGSRSSPRSILTSRAGSARPVAEFLAGKAKLGRVTPPPATVFHDGSGKVMNTIPPNDWSFYEMLNEVVQNEPATSLDAELMGPMAAIGIVKGKPFAPDARMKKIMTDALALANATSRTLFMSPRDPSWFYYPELVVGRTTCSRPATSSRRRSR